MYINETIQNTLQTVQNTVNTQLHTLPKQPHITKRVKTITVQDTPCAATIPITSNTDM